MFANAGVIGNIGSWLDEKAEKMSQVLQINVVGAFLCIKYAAKAMMAGGHGKGGV